MIGWLLSEFGGWLAGAGAALAAFVGAYLTGRRSGRQKAETRALRETQERVEKGRKNVEDLRGVDRDERIRRLRDEWD